MKFGQPSVQSPLVGFLSIGVSGAALLGVAARLSPPDSFRLVGVAWTVTTLFGIGLAAPVEQLIGRRMSALEGGWRRPSQHLVLGGIATCVAVAVWAPSRQSAGDPVSLIVTSGLGVLGWCLVVPGRGSLAGSADFLGYARTLLAESGARSLLTLAGAVDSAHRSTWFALAVSVPLICAAAYTTVRAHHVGSLQRSLGEPPAKDLLSFVTASAGFQICLSVPVLAVDWRAGAHSALVSELVVANTYFRSPTVLLGSINLKALIRLSDVWGRGAPEDFLMLRRALLTKGMLVSVLLTVLVGALSPLLLPLFYGSPLQLSFVVQLALAVSTLVGMGASIVTQGLLARKGASVAAIAWGLGAVVTTALLMTLPGISDSQWPARMGAVLLAGPFLAAIISLTSSTLQRSDIGKVGA